MLPRAALGGLEPIARGGTARLYRVRDFSLPGADELVYKEYKVKVRARAGPALLPGLLALTEFRARLADDRRAQIDKRTIWPLRVVTGDAGGAAGIVMRMIPGEFFHGRRPRELGMLFHAPADAREQGLPQADVATRLTICARVAATYMLLHHAEVIVGDVSASNVVLTAGDRPHVLAVDTDSARVKGTRAAFGSQPHTPFWEPPEAVDAERLLAHAKRAGQASDARLRELADTWQRQTRETDVYKFGLLVVRLLDYGRYRSQNRSPERALPVLRDHAGTDAAGLLVGSLDRDPQARPTMADWYQAFGGRASSSARHHKPGRRDLAAHPGPPAGPAVRQVGDWRFVDGTGWVRDEPKQRRA